MHPIQTLRHANDLEIRIRLDADAARMGMGDPIAALIEELTVGSSYYRYPHCTLRITGGQAHLSSDAMREVSFFLADLPMRVSTVAARSLAEGAAWLWLLGEPRMIQSGVRIHFHPPEDAAPAATVRLPGLSKMHASRSADEFIDIFHPCHRAAVELALRLPGHPVSAPRLEAAGVLTGANSSALRAA